MGRGEGGNENRSPKVMAPCQLIPSTHMAMVCPSQLHPIGDELLVIAIHCVPILVLWSGSKSANLMVGEEKKASFSVELCPTYPKLGPMLNKIK